MNRKIILSLCLCFGVCALGGCAKATDLTEEQQDLIAEYSAGLLLQYEDRYERKLVSEETAVTPSATPLATPSATPVSEVEPTKVPVSSQSVGVLQTGAGDEEEEQFQQSTLDEMYQIQDVTFSYKSYQIGRVYPKKKSAFPMTAKKGQKFFVVRFQVKNTSGQSRKVNLQHRDFTYSLVLDDVEYQPTIVIQKNGGLNYLKTTLPGKTDEEAVLVYSIPSSIKKISSAVLTVQDTKAKKEATITCI